MLVNSRFYGWLDAGYQPGPVLSARAGIAAIRTAAPARNAENRTLRTSPTSYA
jgi:hypothetical protein